MKKLVHPIGSRYENATLAQINLKKRDQEHLMKWLSKKSGLLLLIGPPGTGKTYLTAAIFNEKFDVYGGDRYFTCHQFFGYVRKWVDYNYDEGIEEVARYRNLILDDLGTTQNTEWQKEVFHKFLDYRSANFTKYRTIITSNYSPQMMEDIYGPRVVSRLFDDVNCVLVMDGEDQRTKNKANEWTQEGL